VFAPRTPNTSNLISNVASCNLLLLTARCHAPSGHWPVHAKVVKPTEHAYQFAYWLILIKCILHNQLVIARCGVHSPLSHARAVAHQRVICTPDLRDKHDTANTYMRYGELLAENCEFLLPHPCLTTPFRGNPSEFLDETYRAKTRGMGLLYGENCMILTSTIFDWSTRVTDRRTDGPNCDSICTLRIYALTHKNRSSYLPAVVDSRTTELLTAQ